MALTTFYAGRLRHRVDIEAPIEEQDTTSGEMVVTGWSLFASNVPAEIAPLSAREYLASAALQSDVTARITIRYRVGVLAKMRCKHDDGHGTITYYQLAGKPIRDPVQGLEWLTLPVLEGVYDG
jgi:SPP1 family predicted phage head-tail adaptor